MKSKLSKEQAEKKIKEFFRDLKNKNSKDVKKIKRLAMHYNIKLGEKRRRFCKYCFSVRLKVKKIKRGVKIVECGKCGKISRWKIK